MARPPPAASSSQAPAIEISIRRDGASYKRVPLGPGSAVFGRDEQADVQLEAPHVSRKHFELRIDADKVTVVDLGSRNGIMVRGQKVRQAELGEGDIVSLPHFELRFKWLAKGASRAKPTAKGKGDKPPVRRETIGGGWDDYLDDDEPRTKRKDTGEIPVVREEDAPAPRRTSRKQQIEAQDTAPPERRGTSSRRSLIDEDEEDPEASVRPEGPPLLDQLHAEANSLLYGQKHGDLEVEVMHALDGELVGIAIFGPGGDHWWGGRPGVFSRLNPGTGQFPLVSSTRRGEYRVQVPDDGQWKVLHRGQRPLDVAKRGGWQLYDAEWEDRVEVRHGPHSVFVRCVRHQQLPPDEARWEIWPYADMILAWLLSLIVHTALFGLTAGPQEVRLVPVAAEQFVDVRLAEPPPEPPPPEPPEVVAPKPPKQKPVPPPPETKPADVPAKGSPKGVVTKTKPSPSPPAAPPKVPPKRPEPGPPEAGEGSPEPEAPPAPKSVSVADFKVHGTIGHLPEVKISAGQDRGGGREVFRGRVVKGYVGKGTGGDITPKGSLDGADVSRVVNSHAAEVGECYNGIRENNPTAEGRIDLVWSVRADGKVGSVRLQSDGVGSLSLIKCLKKVIGDWTFPPPQGGEAEVQRAFTFRRPGV